MQFQATTALCGGDRVAALAALDENQVKQLAAFANLCSSGLLEDGQDLLQATYQRWLGSEVPVVGPIETVRFLFGAIRSIKFNEFRRKRAERAAFGNRAEPDANEPDSEDPIELVAANAATAEDSVYAQQLYDALDDTELQLLILHLAEGTPRAQIQAELKWDDKKYDAVQKRKLRTVAKLMREGKI